MNVRRTVIGLLLAIAMVALAAVLMPAGPPTLRQFEPDRMADLETRMWQAYYAKENFRLFALLVTMLREQYHYSWATAVKEGYYLAHAAATFGNARDHYERVLPDLEAGFATAKAWLHADFDPAAVARAELAWWVARRVPGEDMPEHVGALMAESYALLYEAPRSDMMAPAVLRARAGKLRDQTASAPDWDTIGRLLRDSYRDLYGALNDDHRTDKGGSL